METCLETVIAYAILFGDANGTEIYLHWTFTLQIKTEIYV